MEQIPKANNKSFVLISGPCVVEDQESCIQIAKHLQNICWKRGINYFFKASFRKANRSRGDSFTGIGDKEALQILSGLKHTLNIQITTDVHSIEDVFKVNSFVDVIQIPAFLCRQTDLLFAAGDTGLVVNIKKGQFMSPEAMAFAVDKIRNRSDNEVWVTERGNSFGYHDLVVDFRSVPIMQKFAERVFVDCTHSVQRPNQVNGITGGTPGYIDTMASAAIASGADGIFLETHPYPADAKSDGANMLPLDQAEKLLDKLQRIYTAIQ